MNKDEIIKEITIDETSSLPLYVQLRNRISYLIVSGVLSKGDRLPTVRELSVELSMNYNTVNRAYMDLEKDGYIVSRRKLGSFVSTPLKDVVEQDDVTETVNSLVKDLFTACEELGVPRHVILEIVNGYAKYE